MSGGGTERRLMVGAAVVSGLMAAAVVAAAGVLVLRRHTAHTHKLRGLAGRDAEASKDYQVSRRGKQELPGQSQRHARITR